mmetsp:Transcript_39099/g.123309  ORF Transcript_39099/g.123309 Transcript_39099/m.123309 type:complete len:285 (+) Transcript_39099:448-1302(+)
MRLDCLPELPHPRLCAAETKVREDLSKHRQGEVPQARGKFCVEVTRIGKGKLDGGLLAGVQPLHLPLHALGAEGALQLRQGERRPCLREHRDLLGGLRPPCAGVVPGAILLLRLVLHQGLRRSLLTCPSAAFAESMESVEACWMFHHCGACWRFHHCITERHHPRDYVLVHIRKAQQRAQFRFRLLRMLLCHNRCQRLDDGCGQGGDDRVELVTLATLAELFQACLSNLEPVLWDDLHLHIPHKFPKLRELLAFILGQLLQLLLKAGRPVRMEELMLEGDGAGT